MPARPGGRDLAALALRAGLGLTFLLVGWAHTFQGRGVIVDALAFLPYAEEAALAISVAEVVAGALLLVGLLVPVAVLVTIVVNVGAIVVYVASEGGLFLYADVAMVGAALALAAWGPGSLSVERVLGRAAPRLPEPWAPVFVRLGLAGTLLAGALLAFQAGTDGYQVVDARLPFAGAPVAALLAAVAGTLALLGLAPRAVAALTALLALAALGAFGVLGGLTAYIVFFLPTLASALAYAAAGPGAATLPSLLARGPGPVRRDPAPAAWALAGVVLLATIVAGAAPGAPPEAVPAAVPTTRVLELGAGQAQLGEGEAWIGQVPVRGLVLREVVATLTWTDDAPGSGPDEFTLELVPPPGMEAGPAAEGAGGTLRILVPVYRAPPAGNPHLGLGDWHLRVYLRGAGDAATLGLAPGLPDEGNDFQLVVTGTVFER